MSFITTTPPEAARDDVAAMYRRQQDSWGYVPNYARVFCHRPEVMARWGALLAEIKRPMERRRFELATFAAAHELRNSACALAHGRALREWFDDARLVAIAERREHEVLGAAEQALVRFARQIAHDASAVTATQVAALRSHGYTDAEVFDVVAAVAARSFFTRMLDGLGVQMDSAFLALAEPLRQAFTVGRPIDTAPPTRLPDPPAPGPSLIGGTLGC
ncbi:MAG: hypothetical protein U1F56_10975 [Rubrivivax sp.]